MKIPFDIPPELIKIGEISYLDEPVYIFKNPNDQFIAIFECIYCRGGACTFEQCSKNYGTLNDIIKKMNECNINKTDNIIFFKEFISLINNSKAPLECGCGMWKEFPNGNIGHFRYCDYKKNG